MLHFAWHISEGEFLGYKHQLWLRLFISSDKARYWSWINSGIRTHGLIRATTLLLGYMRPWTMLLLSKAGLLHIQACLFIFYLEWLWITIHWSWHFTPRYLDPSVNLFTNLITVMIHIYKRLSILSGKMAFQVHQLQRSLVNFIVCDFICANMLRIIRVILINN